MKRTGPSSIRSVRALAAKLLLAVAGTAAALVLAEASLRLVKGPPPPLPGASDPMFAWRYLDIHDPFFERRGGDLVAVRPRAHRLRFPAKKPAGERRVFIVGESFADLFPAETLEDCFSRAFPGYRWRVLNAGMSAYDSYRVRGVVEEVSSCDPDLVVLLMANNDGQIAPVTLNHWKYRYPLVRGSYVLRALTDLVDPGIEVPPAETGRFFERNLRGIVDVLKERNVPLVVVTLANNLDVPDDPFYWKDPALFAAARDSFPAGRWADTPMYAGLLERNDMLRRAAARGETVVLTDFFRRMEALTAGGPAYDWFWDCFHVWPPVYRLLSDDIVEAYLQYDASLPEGAPGKLSGRRDAGFRRATPEEVLRENRRYMRAEILRDEAADPQVYPYVVPMKLRYFDNALRIYDRYWSVDPEAVVTLRERLPLRPDATPEARRAAWFRYLAAGDCLRRRGRYEAALAHLDDAVAFLPEAWEGYLLRGVCRHAAGMRQAAGGDFAAVRRMRDGLDWLTVPYLDDVQGTRDAAESSVRRKGETP